MAVEATHLNLFPPQILSNREIMLSGFEGTNNLYGTTGMMYGLPPLAKSFPMKAECDLAYAQMSNACRKRPREENGLNFNQFQVVGSTFLGEDFSSHMQMEKLEVDQFITHHMEKVRLELNERRKRCSRTVISAIGESTMKKLKAKDEEIQEIWKLNFVLEEQLKSLCVENQIWRDLAQTSEAKANTLRTNLDQVLALVQDDEQSCCGSNYEEEVEKVVENSRICRRCGGEEASVLLLPCRHLCICSVCGPEVHVCPICNCTKNCSLLVNAFENGGSLS